jgi:hypothetical protein
MELSMEFVVLVSAIAAAVGVLRGALALLDWAGRRRRDRLAALTPRDRSCALEEFPMSATRWQATLDETRGIPCQ